MIKQKLGIAFTQLFKIIFVSEFILLTFKITTINFQISVLQNRFIIYAIVISILLFDFIEEKIKDHKYKREEKNRWKEKYGK